MLGTRTKQVFAYGRRGHRVVNVYDDYDRRKDIDSNHTKNEVLSSDLSAKVYAPPVKSENNVVSSRRKAKKSQSPKTLKLGGIGVAKPAVRRHILGSIAPNAPASPALSPPLRTNRRQTVAEPSSLLSGSPIVQADIVVIDSQGRRVSQEHRTLRTHVQANILADTPSKPAKGLRSKVGTKKRDAIVVISDSEDEEVVPMARPRRQVRRKAKRIVSDEEDESESNYTPPNDLSSADTSIEDITPQTPTPRIRRGSRRARPNVIQSPLLAPSLSASSSTSDALPALSKATLRDADTLSAASVPASHLIHNLTLLPQLARPETLAPFASLPDAYKSGPSRSKPRQLTPYRKRPGRAIFPAPPSPPSPTTTSELDLDITYELAQLALSSHTLADAQRLDVTAGPRVPEHVRSLLSECAQTTPHEFSAFIQMFPSDPLVRLGAQASGALTLPKFQKIGEASYSEVFGIGSVVLKIIPLRDEERGTIVSDVDGPPPSDARDVLKEMIVTKAMGECCSGFVELLRTYVVRGKYPSLLLDLWDEYDERKGSESVRPDTFTVSQLYAIIVLPNGGPDLEAYIFGTPTKTGWRQACSIFWQVTRTLSEAENLVGFEHRDLHWGQILVKNVPVKSTAWRKTRTSMDGPDYGVLVTIIDLGLSRMDALDDTHWTPFDEETFEGEGDYQFDVYRMMRAHNADEWAQFRPLTNVMWLHYLVLKLLQSKRLRPPAVARKSTVGQPAGGFTERECYECLKEVEGILARCLVGVVKVPQAARKGRRKTQAPVKASSEAVGPRSAGELLKMAQTRGWMQ